MAEVPASKERLLEEAVTVFRKVFDGQVPTHAGCAPGRVNLIGEHTDYNDGYVFPMALPNVTVVVGGRNSTDNYTIYSEGVSADKTVTFSNKELQRGEPGWANYVKGVINYFGAAPVPGFNAVVLSTVPLGAGLSSSASIEVATFTFIEALTGTKVDTKEKTLRCQKAEHVFAEMPCGIMDQYVSIHGRGGHALLLDCKTVTHENIPFGDSNVRVLITNSNMKHKLDGSEYPMRAAQCREAAKIMGLKSLREATLENLEKHRNQMSDGVYRRARHVISETSRTYEAAKALRSGNYTAFGQFMIQSHNSLRDDFEVSTKELDELVSIGTKCEGVYGSRLTGAGFGGSTVTLVKSENVNQVIEALKKSSLKRLDFHVSLPSDGAENLTSMLHEVLSSCSLSTKKSTMTQTKSLVK